MLYEVITNIDQKPIGRTPRSNPATYTKLFDPIRDLFAMLPESQSGGYKKGRYSFNVKGGRCEARITSYNVCYTKLLRNLVIVGHDMG